MDNNEQIGIVNDKNGTESISVARKALGAAMAHSNCYCPTCKILADEFWSLTEDYGEPVMPPRPRGISQLEASLISSIKAAWDVGVAKWRENHESIPTAFVGLADVLDAIPKKGG